MANENKKNKSGMGILFAILIPIVILAILAAALYFIMNSEKGKESFSNVPFISSFILDDSSNAPEKDLERASQTIEEQEDEIEDLQREIDSLEDLMDEQEKDIKKMEKSEDSRTENDDAEETVNEVKQVAGSFRKMDPEKAAGIVESMDEQSALDVLEKMSGDVRGGILAEMESKKAAKLTEALLQ